MDTFGRREERYAVHGMFSFIPASANPEIKPAV